MRQVGDVHHERGQIVLDARQAFFSLLQFVADPGDLAHQRAGILAFALGHADLLGELVATGLQILGTGLDFLAFGFQRLDTRGIEAKTPAGQALRHIGEIFAEKLNIEHGVRWLRMLRISG